MKYWVIALGMLVLFSCRRQENIPGVQDLIDQAIAVSGGERYGSSEVIFTFRDKEYRSYNSDKGKVLSRFFYQDSSGIRDILEGSSFTRLRDGQPIAVPDSMAVKFGNSINSVHYFVRLPYGLNDPAVLKRYLGAVDINGEEYYKVEVTFKEAGGGEDFEDIYVYWFNKKTLKPDFLAYEFHVNGGGVRFRKALNERYVGGIRFVDYENYKPKSENVRVYVMDSLYEKGELELFSKIELGNITVTPDNYN